MFWPPEQAEVEGGRRWLSAGLAWLYRRGRWEAIAEAPSLAGCSQATDRELKRRRLKVRNTALAWRGTLRTMRTVKYPSVPEMVMRFPRDRLFSGEATMSVFMPWGKHRGQPLSSLSRSYLR